MGDREEWGRVRGRTVGSGRGEASGMHRFELLFYHTHTHHTYTYLCLDINVPLPSLSIAHNLHIVHSGLLQDLLDHIPLLPYHLAYRPVEAM